MVSKQKNYLHKAIFTSKPLMGLYFILFIVYAMATVQFSKLLGLTFDIASGTMKKFWPFATELLIVTIVMIFLSVMYSWVKVNNKKRIGYNLRFNLYDNIQKKTISQFREKERDNYISAMVNDTLMLENNYIEPYLKTIEEVIMLIISATAIVTIHWAACIFVIIVSLIPIFVPNLFIKKLQTKMMNYSIENELFLKKVTENVEGFEVFKNYGANEQVMGNFENKNNKLGKIKKSAYQYMDVLISTVAVSSNLMLIGTLVFGMFMALNGWLTIGEVFAITFLSGSVAAPLSTIASNLPQILGAKEIINKYNSYFDSSLDEKIDLEGELSNISVSHVSLEFGARKILDDISIELGSGKKYAFVGTTGSGKSTLIKTILGYYSHYDGNITFNDQPLKSLNESSIYRQISFVPQSTTLFYGTLRDNLTFFKDDINENELKDIISKSMLQSKIESLNKGVETIISENGGNFSGGEKQRIAIARALLKKNKILFMDEATSALDYETYIEIERMLLNEDLTILSVTHRINKEILSLYDEIFVFHEGRLVEKGNYSNLLSLNGYFTELVMTQKVS